MGKQLFIWGFVAVITIIEGFVLMTLWNWFMVPVLHLPTLTFVPALGIGLVIGHMTSTFQFRTVPEDFEGGKEYLKQLAYYVFGRPVVVLVIGWILHSMMK